jgi:tripartite-type tricarboxylate transporter receptor subunit TctC
LTSKASLNRRQACALAAATLPGFGLAQAFPSKSIRLIVPATTGGGPDTVARLAQPRLNQIFGQAVVIENRPGAATNIGTEMVAKAPADGHTLLISTPSIATNQFLYANTGYDLFKDFASVMLLTSQPYILALHPSVPAKNLQELVEFAKSKKRMLTYASTGSGQFAHLAMELLKARTGMEITHVPYKGASAAMPDLVSGRVDMFFTTPASASVHIQDGRLRAVAVSGSRRSKAFPAIPTVAEQGVADYRVDGWYGLHVPAGTPKDTITRIHKAFHEALHQPQAAQGIEKMGADLETSSPAELDALLRKEAELWSGLIKKLNIKVE